MRLITLGDSWVWGVGADYQEGMSEKNYKDIAWNQSKNCFRQLISNHFDLENLNLSRGGSSNQAQFRLALNTFFGKDKINIQETDIVLWGITSVFRTELWHTDKAEFKDIFLPDATAVSKILAVHHHSEKEELTILGHQMQLWNTYFKSMNIKNYWFNVFNDHSWDIKIDNFLFEKASLLSFMVNDYTENDKYHTSRWDLSTDRKITTAKEMKLVNPITGHPTKKSHEMIAEQLLKKMEGKQK
jgi:hypothetical protein